MVEKDDVYGERFEGRCLVGDDKNGQEHGSSPEINKFSVGKHETTFPSSLSAIDARCHLEDFKVQICVA